MHPAIVRHLISPALEHALRRPTFAYLKELERVQWRSAEQLRKIQNARLRRLFRIAERCCPYYAALFRSHRMLSDAQDSFAELAKLPLLDKGIVRRNLDAMTNQSVPGGPIRFNTGGSTGEPLVFYVDRSRIAADKAVRILSHAWFDAQCGEPEAYLWGSPVEWNAQDRIKRVRDRLTNELLLNAFDLSPESINRYIARINAFDPVSIYGYPSSLAALATYCRSRRLPFTGRRLQAVFTSGEQLDSDQRWTLQDFFGVRVADGYGSRDGGFIAHECPYGKMHIFDPHVIVEIVDQAGQTLPSGQEGEMVITHLEGMAAPLIRYRTGDLGILDDAPCACGRGLGVLGMVAGRRTDQLVAQDGSVQHALSAIYVIRELRTVRQFQIRQHLDRRVDVLVVPDAGFSAGDRRHIRGGMTRRLGDIPIRVRLTDKIDVEASGKYRHVISEAADGSAISGSIKEMSS